MKISTTFIFVVFFLVVTLGPGCHRSEASLSVCEALSKLDFYQGKQIVVRGTYHWTRHGSYLGAEWECIPRRAGIQLSFLVPTTDVAYAALDNAGQVQRSRRKKGMEPLEITATFTGIVERREEVRVIRDDLGVFHATGGGPWAARLSVSDVEDIRIRFQRGFLARNSIWIIVLLGFTGICLGYILRSRRLDAHRCLSGIQ